MPAKILDVPDIGEVAFYKRRGSRSIRLTIAPTRAVRVTMPYWVPYATGVAFVRSKTAWIQNQLDRQQPAVLEPGRQIGKTHTLDFKTGPQVFTTTSRLSGNNIIVTYPSQLSWDDEAVQTKAKQAAIRALRREAEQALPARLHDLALEHGFHYRSVTVKHLKRRWGSCDQHHDIVCNLFLMQLPWDLIDYVLLHELTHTKHLNHSPEFWNEMDRLLPNVTARRRQLRRHQPAL